MKRIKKSTIVDYVIEEWVDVCEQYDECGWPQTKREGEARVRKLNKKFPQGKYRLVRVTTTILREALS